MDRRLGECVQHLQSHLVNVRKKSINELQDLLQHPEIIKQINETSENDRESTVTWDTVFVAAHNALLKEIEKLTFECGKTKSRVSFELSKNVHAGALISIIVAKANSDIRYLDCARIIDATIYILKKAPHKILVGHIYESMLRQHVLSVEKCWHQITTEQWKDLFDVSKHILNDPPPRCSMSSVVQMMNLIVLHGCEQTSFIEVLKKEKILILLEKIIDKAVTDKNVDLQFNTLSLLVTVCQKLQKECRMAICKFGEEILHKILNMYESKGESGHKKTQKIIDFLLILMEAHHPCGMSENSEKVYAYNWESWKSSLKQLNYVTIREISVLPRLGRMSENFLKLVVEVYNQIFRMNINSVNITVNYSFNETSFSSDVSTVKKRRINCGFSDIIERLNSVAKPIDMWPWLAVLSSLISKYPRLVSSSDYALILQNVSTYLSASKEPLVTDYLCRCGVALIDVRLKLNHEDIKADEETWNSIWNLILRTIGLNQNVESSHALLRCMVKFMWKPSMRNTVLKLYLQHVRFSKDSLLTLYDLRERTAFPPSIIDIPVPTSLLRWLIPPADLIFISHILSDIPIDVYARITLLCCLKNNVKKACPVVLPLSIEDDLLVDNSVPVSVLYSLNSYDSDALLNFTNSQTVDVHENVSQYFSLNIEAFELLTNFLAENCESLLEKCRTTTDKMLLLHQLGLYFMFLVNILKFKNHYAIEWNAVRVENMQQTLLIELTLLMKDLLTPELNKKKLVKCFNFLAEMFKHLGTVPGNIAHTILESLFPQLQYIFAVFEFGISKRKQEDDMEYKTFIGSEEEHQTFFDCKTFSISDQLRFEACKVLIHFSYHYDFLCETQKNILNAVLDVLENVEEKQRSTCFLQMTVYSCHAALKIENLDSMTFRSVTHLIQILCETRRWSQTEESALIILKLIKRGFQAVSPDNSDGWNHLKIFLNGMSTLLQEGGIRTTVEMIHCLGFFANTKIGDHCFDTTNDADQPLSLICENIFPYLKDTSHEIRITAASFLTKIFTVVDHLVSHRNFNVHDNLIMKFMETLRDCFSVDDSMMEDIDETVNRPITVLYSLICAVCSSKVGRRKIICGFFDIIYEKHIKPDLGRRTLLIAKDHFKLDNVLNLVKDNFLFVSWYWLKKYNTFENFPCEVVGCKSLKEFYVQFLKDIVVVSLFYGKTEVIDSISRTIESSTFEIFSNCFPEIMSLVLIKIAAGTGAPFDGITADELHEIVAKTIENDTLEDQMVARLPDVLVSILRNLHDPQFEVPPTGILPNPVEFVADKNLVEETIAYLKSSAGVDTPSLVVYIAQGYPRFIQKIFQKLYIDVLKSSTSEIKLSAFQRYILFCQFLFPYYQDLHQHQMVTFMTRTILYNTLNFISSTTDYIALSLSALKFLEAFIVQWVSDDYQYETSTFVFKKYLSYIVDKLVPLASRNDDLGDAALNVLRSLLIDQSECLFDSISKLDQLPNLPAFEPFRSSYLQEQETQMQDSSLINDIKQFLNAAKFSPQSPCRVESLRFLRKQLSLLKPELFKIFESVVNQQLFSEDCVESIPHRLILALLHSIDLRDDEVSYEAICCLGEIGLVDLNTIVLQPNHDIADSSSDAETLIIKELCRELTECIVDENVNIVNASCQTLKLSLLCKNGYRFAKENSNSFDKLLIYPFIPPSSDEVDMHTVEQYFRFEKFEENVDSESLWVPVQNISHETWVTNIVCAILESFSKKCFLNAVQSVCRLKVTVAENIFKYLVYLLTDGNFGESKRILGTRINQFFENFFISNKIDTFDSYSSNHSSAGKNLAIFCNKSSIQCLLEVVHFVRLHQSDPNLNDLEINYLYAANAAQYCSAFFPSLLYSELWLNSLIRSSNVEYDGNVSSFLEMVGEKSSSIDPNQLLNILRKAFSKIGDSDALFGCRSSILINPETRVEHYRQVGNWQRVIESCDLQLSMNENSFTSINDLSSAIAFSGFNHLQNNYLSSLNPLNSQLTDGLYESGWKLRKWDLEDPPDEFKTYNYYHFATLKDLHQRNFNGALVNVMNARKCIIPTLATAVFDSTKNLYCVISKLQCLQEVEDIVSADCRQTVFENWTRRDHLSVNLSFSHKHVILNQRLCMIDSSSIEGKNVMLNIAKKARKEGSFQFADSCLAIAREKERNQLDLFELKVRFEDAQLLWMRKEQHEARYVLKNLQKQASNTNPVFFSSILRTYGKWLSEINLESADTILDNYFLPASRIILEESIDSRKECKNRLKTYKCVAEFADLQYRALSEYIKSDEFEEQIKSVSESKKQSDALGEQTPDMRKTKIQLANQSKIEDSQVKEIREREKSYLVLAMRYYLKILAEGADEDLKVFRIVSFWLHNKSHVELHREIRETMFQIPSYKFVPVLPQLMAHISPEKMECFGHSLNQLIEKCIVDHPHHTLPLIFSLANYTKDQQFEKNKKSARIVRKEDRVLAAADYVNKFRSHEHAGKTVIEMEKLSEAYIQFAYYKVSRSVQPGEAVPIPSQYSILKVVNNFENIICPTITLPVNKNAIYSNIIGIRRIEPKYTVACGINAPKKIACLCTDGRIRHQLVKGQDDMRVDAVMQQVFTIMNKLLSENKRTSKRKLLIRTYKVVPLSQRSGVLEWCMNTISLGEYLVFRNHTTIGAHHRLRPDDLRTDKARKRIEAARILSDVEKIVALQKVFKELKPVFRYFFVEKFPLPTMWFERKLAYTHSVAVTSMVGYILGIGDRHVQNMLIDETTAEIIHIDFGIAFDQGQNLNCPELIPFRLTRDIEDGMGIFSIDGIFRRCCEQTLMVLRENSDIIRTTIEVFIHDPLFQWTVTPEKKASLQDMLGDCANRMNQAVEVSITASRALSRIKLKLQGLEKGTATTVEGQVNRLIQQAKDVRNLSKLFCGWQAFL